MDEGGRYLRYIIPGVASIVQFIILALISGVPFSGSELISAVSANSGIGVAFTVLIASGGLGYLLAQVYFGLRTLPGLKGLLHQDHSGFFQNQEVEKALSVKGLGGDAPGADDLRANWAMFCTLWHMRRGNSTSLEKTDRMVGSLTGHMHSLGATFVGVVIAFVVWLALVGCPFFTWCFLMMLLAVPIITSLAICCVVDFRLAQLVMCEEVACWNGMNIGGIFLAMIVGVVMIAFVWFAFRSTLKGLVEITNAAMINDLQGKRRKPFKFYWPVD